MSQLTLELCPFCPNEAKLQTLRTDGGFRYAVKCSVCGCGTPYYADKSWALSTWNTRPSHGWRKFDAGDERTWPSKHAYYPVQVEDGCGNWWEKRWDGMVWVDCDNSSDGSRVLAYYELPEWRGE